MGSLTALFFITVVSTIVDAENVAYKRKLVHTQFDTDDKNTGIQIKIEPEWNWLEQPLEARNRPRVILIFWFKCL